MNIYDKLASAIYNDIVSGLRGMHHNPSLSIEQLEDDIVDTRLQILKEYSLKGILPVEDLLTSINCIPVDCKDLDRCTCSTITGKPVAHFEIPQLLNDYGSNSIQYIGSTDRQFQFVWSTSAQWKYHWKYSKRGKRKPFVYIDITPNKNGMYDCFIFNAPLLKEVSVVAIFKDLRQLEGFSCCSDVEGDNFNFINNEIKNRLTAQKIKYYRQLAAPILPNTQQYNAG